MPYAVPVRRLAGGIVAAAALAALPTTVSPPAAEAGVVPNQFVRDCSYVTRRCTGFWQINGRYDGRYPSVYYTRWVWRWI
jgi:hypothetical protein